MTTQHHTRSETAVFPEGTCLLLDESVRRAASGQVLLGGSPLRLLRLKPNAARQLDRWIHGEPVDASNRSQRLAQRLIATGLLHPDPPAAPFNPTDVTLVTPVKNNPTGLARLLAATSHRTEHIIVDDGSDTPVPQAALRHERPAGPAAARDTGWQHARTDLVAFVDADVSPEPDWLDTLLPQFADPTVAAAAPRVRSTPGNTAVAHYETERSSLDLGQRPATVRPMSRVSYVPTAALVVRRTALHEIGGFDPRLRFGEDVDLIWRLLAAGHTVRYVPSSVVWHQPRPTLRSWLRQRFDYGTSAAPLSTRHPGLLSPAKTSPYSAATWALLAAGRPLPALGVAALSAALLPHKLRGRGLPIGESLRLAALGHAGAGRLLAEATRRAWWPLALAAAVNRRARRVVLVALLPCFIDAAGKDGRWLLLRVLDDLAYGAGLWAGCARTRTTAALRPDFTGSGS